VLGLPDYASIGAWLFHTATGEPLDLKGIRKDQSYLGESAGYHVWLIYKPELDFLKSREASLTLSFAERIAGQKDKAIWSLRRPGSYPKKCCCRWGWNTLPCPSRSTVSRRSNPMHWQDYIHNDPAVLVGKPVIKGTRLSVDFLLGLLAEGWTEARILENYPQLSREALQAVFAFTAEVMRDETIYPLRSGAA